MGHGGVGNRDETRESGNRDGTRESGEQCWNKGE